MIQIRRYPVSESNALPAYFRGAMDGDQFRKINPLVSYGGHVHTKSLYVFWTCGKSRIEDQGTAPYIFIQRAFNNIYNISNIGPFLDFTEWNNGRATQNVYWCSKHIFVPCSAYIYIWRISCSEVLRINGKTYCALFSARGFQSMLKRPQKSSSKIIPIDRGDMPVLLFPRGLIHPCCGIIKCKQVFPYK